LVTGTTTFVVGNVMETRVRLNARGRASLLGYFSLMRLMSASSVQRSGARHSSEKHLDAADALRQAQLTLDRHPETVALLKKRGGDFTESDLPKEKSEAGG
jgi:hypothetical protein